MEMRGAVIHLKTEKAGDVGGLVREMVKSAGD